MTKTNGAEWEKDFENFYVPFFDRLGAWYIGRHLGKETSSIARLNGIEREFKAFIKELLAKEVKEAYKRGYAQAGVDYMKEVLSDAKKLSELRKQIVD